MQFFFRGRDKAQLLNAKRDAVIRKAEQDYFYESPLSKRTATFKTASQRLDEETTKITTALICPTHCKNEVTVTSTMRD